jgi:hypothetical protein
MNRKIGRSEEGRSSDLPIFLCLLALSGCPRKASPSAEAGVVDAGLDVVVAAADPRLEELWARAKDGEADDLARLADREGSGGLEERASDPGARLTALRAAGFAGGLDVLPWLADVASHGTDAEAEAALDSAARLAAEPRRAVDPDDALEVRAGCDALVALAKTQSGPRARRIGAIRVLRMLADRGCAPPDQIPTDLDSK